MIMQTSLNSLTAYSQGEEGDYYSMPVALFLIHYDINVLRDIYSTQTVRREALSLLRHPTRYQNCTKGWNKIRFIQFLQKNLLWSLVKNVSLLTRVLDRRSSADYLSTKCFCFFLSSSNRLLCTNYYELPSLSKSCYSLLKMTQTEF